MCEPLRGKTFLDYYGYRVIIADDVKSAVEFYKKYKDNPDFLQIEHKDIYLNLRKMLSKKYPDDNTGSSITMWFMHEFNDWLFDYCFRDVI